MTPPLRLPPEPGEQVVTAGENRPDRETDQGDAEQAIAETRPRGEAGVLERARSRPWLQACALLVRRRFPWRVAASLNLQVKLRLARRQQHDPKITDRSGMHGWKTPATARGKSAPPEIQHGPATAAPGPPLQARPRNCDTSAGASGGPCRSPSSRPSPPCPVACSTGCWAAKYVIPAKAGIQVGRDGPHFRGGDDCFIDCHLNRLRVLYPLLNNQQRMEFS